MNSFLNTSRSVKTGVFAVLALLTSQCSDEEELRMTGSESDVVITAQSTTTVSPEFCSACTYVVPSSAKQQVVDGKLLGIKPGNVICLSASNTYASIIFRNIIGTGAEPVIITNCGGTATVNGGDASVALKTEYSKYFRIKGGSTPGTYGIKVTGGSLGISLEKLSTNFEVNNIDVSQTSFAGIMAKTEPTCDDATIRGNFVMRNISLHDNFVHDTGGEGFYIGHSLYEKGKTLDCGVRLPHIIDGLRIYNNLVQRAGWDGIQVGCALNGAYVYRNKIEDYGYLKHTYHDSGIQFSEGTKGICYRNWISNGPGIGINAVGYGDCLMHNNVIINAGTFGIFCDERVTRDLPGFQILNNTIINPKSDGMRLYNEYVPAVVYNNIVVSPGNYFTYVYPRSATDAYVYKIAKTIPVDIANNIFTLDISQLQFRDPSILNFKLKDLSPARDAGKDISAFNLTQDYYGGARLKGSQFDIGASEY
jgi:hypothetical protein